MNRSWLVLADGYLATRNAKTAHGVLRYSKDGIAAVIDSENAGRDLADVLPEIGRSAPIVASVAEGLDRSPTSLLLGVATPGGWIPDHWQSWLREAIAAGLEIANGLHRFLTEDAELVRLAEEHGARLWDVRKPPDEIPLFTGRSLEVAQKIVLTVGSDCAVGKMTAALELKAAAEADGTSADFVATGQTGVLISGWGVAVDRVISDFTSGAAEMLVLQADESADVLVVEGQGSLWHPAYAGVTLGLLHGSAPHAMVLCHKAGHTAIEEPPYTPLPPLEDMIQTYEQMALTVRPAPVVAIALNCGRLDDPDAAQACLEIEEATGLPTADVFRGGGAILWQAVKESVVQR